jgi:Large polyvalent protein associated domain 29
MAHITATRVNAVRAQLKRSFPNWRFAVSKNGHSSTLYIRILSAPVHLAYMASQKSGVDQGRFASTSLNVNPARYFEGDALDWIKQICAIANAGNHDNSDPMVDYFDVGWYFYLHLGTAATPFKCLSAPALRLTSSELSDLLEIERGRSMVAQPTQVA